MLGGPGQRTEVERTQGKHGHTLSTNTIVDQPSCVLAKEVVTKVVKALEEITRVIPYFDGAAIDYIPDVWHDGAPKSVMSHEIFEQVAQFRHVNKMKDSAKHASIDVFWEEALNRTDVTLVKTVIVFCSNESLGRILRGTNLLLPDARTCAAGGVIIPINIPINAQASVCLGCGPFAHHNLQWGTTTKEEYQAMHNTADPHSEPSLATTPCAEVHREASIQRAQRFLAAIEVVARLGGHEGLVEQADKLEASTCDIQTTFEQASFVVEEFVGSEFFDPKNPEHVLKLMRVL